MAVKLIGQNQIGAVKINKWLGNAADTDTWLTANTSEESGSTYMEADGDQRLFKILAGTWHEQ